MLNDLQLRTLRAVVARIVPSDDGLPGAQEAGAYEYLLAGFSHDLASYVPLYQEGLDALEAMAHETHGGTSFADLTPGAQDALLSALDAARSRFFRILCEQVQEGYYISPLAWEVIGWRVTDEIMTSDGRQLVV